MQVWRNKSISISNKRSLVVRAVSPEIYSHFSRMIIQHFPTGVAPQVHMAMAIALWRALAIALLHKLFTQASEFDETVYVGILKNVFRNCFNCERKVFAPGPH